MDVKNDRNENTVREITRRSDRSEWNQLEQKLDTAIEHTNTEMHQIAEIYKRLGMVKQASEIEETIAEQEQIVHLDAHRQDRRRA